MLALLHQNKIFISLEIDNAPNALADGSIFNRMMIEEFGILRVVSGMRLAVSWNALGNAYIMNKEWKEGEEMFPHVKDR